MAGGPQLAEPRRQVESGWELRFNIAIDSILEFEPYYHLIDKLYRLQPDIEINIHEEVLGGSLEAVIDDRVDLILGAGKPPASAQGYKYVEMQTVQWVFAVPPEHELARRVLPSKHHDIDCDRAVVLRARSRRFPPVCQRRLMTQRGLRGATITAAGMQHNGPGPRAAITTILKPVSGPMRTPVSKVVTRNYKHGRRRQ